MKDEENKKTICTHSCGSHREFRNLCPRFLARSRIFFFFPFFFLFMLFSMGNKYRSVVILSGSKFVLKKNCMQEMFMWKF